MSNRKIWVSTFYGTEFGTLDTVASETERGVLVGSIHKVMDFISYDAGHGWEPAVELQEEIKKLVPKIKSLDVDSLRREVTRIIRRENEFEEYHLWNGVREVELFDYE